MIMFTSSFPLCKECHIWIILLSRGSLPWNVKPTVFGLTEAIYKWREDEMKRFALKLLAKGPARWNAGVQTLPHNRRAMIFWDMGLSVRSNREDLWEMRHLNVHLSKLSQKPEIGVGAGKTPSKWLRQSQMCHLVFFLRISTDCGLYLLKETILYISVIHLPSVVFPSNCCMPPPTCCEVKVTFGPKF